MALADRIRRRWQNAWGQVTAAEIDALRAVIAWAEDAGPWPINRLAEEADVHPHDVRNFLAGSRRPRHGPGLRMLWFAARLKQSAFPKPAEIQAGIETLSRATDRLATFEPDNDYFFRHLQRLDLMDEEKCKAVCADISGHYYSHRLSRNPGNIIRSHYDFLAFTPYNRLPHVINRLKYGSVDDPTAVERTAEGQLIQMADTMVLIGFVYRGYRRVGRRPQDGIKYDGIQINLFPAGQMGRDPPSVIEGLFLSYVYNERYEMGRMKLVRKTRGGRLKFDPQQVGEFTEGQIHKMEPDLDLSGLKLDVSQLLKEEAETFEKPGGAFLASCLSFMLTQNNLSFNAPA